MNERIDKLMVKAGAYFGGEGVDYSNFDPKKLALLIVRECARLAIEKQTENDIAGIVSKNPAKDFAYALVEHFGVEE